MASVPSNPTPSVYVTGVTQLGAVILICFILCSRVLESRQHLIAHASANLRLPAIDQETLCLQIKLESVFVHGHQAVCSES